MAWISIGGFKNANDPPTMVLEMVVCNMSPVVCLFHRVELVALDVSDLRVHWSAVVGGYLPLTWEQVMLATYIQGSGLGLSEFGELVNKNVK